MAKFEFKAKEYSASDVVNRRMVDYTIDVAEHKLPHVIDGLKVVHRRILWVLYNAGFFNTNNLLNTAMGKIIEYHPVGDQSINDACTRLCQDFSMGLRLLQYEGNAGSYGMAKGGAPRYLHVGIDDLAKEIFFDKVNLKTLPKKPSEDLKNVEPVYLIPRLPTSLMIASFTVGSGVKSNIIPMYFDNVCELVKRYAEIYNESNGLRQPDFTKFSKLFIPDIPILNTIRNSSELINNYNQGKYNTSLYIDSEVEIKRNSIIIKTIPFGMIFSDMIEEIKKLARDKKSWMADIITNFHNGQNDEKIGNVELTFKNNKDIFEIFKKLAPVINYTSSVTPIFNYISKHNHVVEMTPPTLLATWYRERRASILGGIKYDQEAESRLLRIKEVKLKVCDHTDEIIDIIRNKSKNVEEAIAILKQKFELSYNQANIILSAELKTLNKQSKDEILADIERHTKKCIELKEQVGNVDDIIFRDAEYFQKKYKKQRTSKISDYRGCIVINNKDIIQWDNTEDACKTISEFPGCKVYTYPDKHTYKFLYPVLTRGPKRDIGISKISQGERIFAYTNENYYTLWIKNNKPICTEGTFTDMDEARLGIPVTSKFIGITPKGEIIKCKVSDLLAKRVTSRTKVDYELAFGVPYYNQGVALIYANDTEPEKINIVKIDDNTKKILLSPIGKTEFIGFIPLHSTAEYIFNCPDIIKGSYKYINIKNIDNLIDDKNPVNTVIVGRKMKRNDIVREMIEL